VEGSNAATEARRAEEEPVAASSPAAAPDPDGPTPDFRSAVAAYERSLLQDALAKNRFNQRATASALGLSYDQLRHALKRHKLLDGEPA
jgi:psp operon transcriptional activator